MENKYFSPLLTSSNLKEGSKQISVSGWQTAYMPSFEFRDCHFWVSFVRNSSHNNMRSQTSWGSPVELWNLLCLRRREKNASNPAWGSLLMCTYIWKWASEHHQGQFCFSPRLLYIMQHFRWQNSIFK